VHRRYCCEAVEWNGGLRIGLSLGGFDLSTKNTMKNLKTFFLVSLAVSSLCFSANAQNFVSQRLINAQAIYFTNAATFVTNLTSAAGLVSGATNGIGMLWTNNFGQTESPTNITPAYTNSPSIATNIGATYNLLKTANIVYNRDNSYLTAPGTNSCIFIHTIPDASGSANATNAISVVIAGVPNPSPTFPLLSPEVAGLTETFTTTLATAVTGSKGKGWYFGLNNTMLMGCKQFMVVSVSTVASGAAASDFWIDDIEYCASQP